MAQNHHMIILIAPWPLNWFLIVDKDYPRSKFNSGDNDIRQFFGSIVNQLGRAQCPVRLGRVACVYRTTNKTVQKN